MLINIPLIIEVSKANKVDVVALSKMVAKVGAEYASLKNQSDVKIDFGGIIKAVCGRYHYQDLFAHLPYEAAVGQYFGKSKMQKAELDAVILKGGKIRIRVGVQTHAIYTIIRAKRKELGKMVEKIVLRHNCMIRPKGTRYDDQLMPSYFVEYYAVKWLQSATKHQLRAAR
jgi:hypothetical protein